MSGIVTRPDWFADANCHGRDTAMFFRDAETDRAGRDATEAAIAICRACDVQVECLTYALNIDETEGVALSGRQPAPDCRRAEADYKHFTRPSRSKDPAA